MPSEVSRDLDSTVPGSLGAGLLRGHAPRCSSGFETSSRPWRRSCEPHQVPSLLGLVFWQERRTTNPKRQSPIPHRAARAVLAWTAGQRHRGPTDDEHRFSQPRAWESKMQVLSSGSPLLESQTAVLCVPQRVPAPLGSLCKGTSALHEAPPSRPNHLSEGPPPNTLTRGSDPDTGLWGDTAPLPAGGNCPPSPRPQRTPALQAQGTLTSYPTKAGLSLGKQPLTFSVWTSPCRPHK